MPSPFPGMDPYLESPVIWPDVHNNLIIGCQAALNPELPSHYVCRVELRVYVSEEDDPGRTALIPDLKIDRQPGRKGSRKVQLEPVLAAPQPLIMPTLMAEEVEEATLKIIHVESEDVVALIEVLSPTNKIQGSCGRKSFMAKRQQVLNTEVHWVEIDLLRAGTPSVNDPAYQRCDYRILVSHGKDRLRTRFWPVSIRDPLPIIDIPLRGKDSAVPLELGTVLSTAYDRAAYNRSVNYRKEPDPPLQGEDAKWAKGLLKSHRGK